MPVNAFDIEKELKRRSIDDELKRRGQTNVMQNLANQAKSDIKGSLETIKNAATSAKKAFTGEGQPSLDIPELPQNLVIGGKAIPVQDFISEARGNPIAEQQIFEERINSQLPEGQKITFEVDEAGKNIAVFPDGKKFNLNQPGATPADFSRTMVEAIPDVGGAVVGARVGAKFGQAGRALGAGAGAASGSVLLDKIAQIDGSQLPVDQKRAALIGLFGAFGESGAIISERFLSKILGSKTLLKDGQLTRQGQELFDRLGVPQEAQQDLIGAIIRNSRETVNNVPIRDQIAAGAQQGFEAGLKGTPQQIPRNTLEQATIRAEAESLPVPVRLSRGQITQDPIQQSFEEGARSGARGQEALGRAQEFDRRTQESLKGNVEEIQKQIAGGEPRVLFEQPGLAAAKSVNTLKGLHAAYKNRVSNNYTAAKKTKASVPKDAVEFLQKNAENLLIEKGFDLGQMPRVQSLLSQLTQGGEGLSKIPKFIDGQGNVNVTALQLWRKRLNKAIDTVGPRSEEGAGLIQLKKMHDEFLEGALDSGLMKGDQGSLAAWKRAIKSNAFYHETFRSNKVIAKLIDEDATSAQILNYLFGASKLGSKKESAFTLKRLEGIFGKDSDSWNALREEAFLRLLRNQPLNASGQLKEVSGAKLLTQIASSFRESPELMSVLFSPREMRLLRSFANVADRATTLVKGAGNPPKTAFEIMRRQGERLFGSGGRVADFMIEKILKLSESNAIRARQAFDPIPVPVRVFPLGLTGGAGGEAAVNSVDRDKLIPSIQP